MILRSHDPFSIAQTGKGAQKDRQDYRENPFNPAVFVFFAVFSCAFVGISAHHEEHEGHEETLAQDRPRWNR
ncbi:MAG: hypothetical protein Q8Q12_09550 [bacterium]|nr:hypothetical protein [bacterium]